MVQKTLVDPRFVETLRKKVADYFRAQHPPELPPDIPQASLNDPQYSDPRVRVFPQQISQWIAFVPALFSPTNCTQQFREKFGATIDEAWNKMEIQALWEERFHSWMATWVFKEHLKRINHPGLPILQEMIKQWEGSRNTKFVSERDSNNFTAIYEWFREINRKTTPNPPIFPFPAELQDVELYFHSISFYIEFTRKISNQWISKIFPKFWESENHLVDECTRVLVRLTEKPDGALVSLWDLLDQQDYARYLIIREIFAWVTREVPAPVPYDPGAAVFTKVSDTFDAIQQLARSFDDWKRETEKK